MNSKIKTAIIGVSGYGACHYNICMKAVEDGLIEMKAAVIINPEDEAEKIQQLKAMGCQIFSSSEEMFKSLHGQLDLVCIPTSIGTHAPFTIAALEAGANVWVEKPVAGTLKEVDAMIEAAHKAKKHVSVGFQDMYRPDLYELKQDILNGVYGKISNITVHGRWPRNHHYYQRNHWAGKLSVNNATINDSPANNAMSHYMNIALFLAGPELGQMAEIQHIDAELFRANDIESFDTAAIRLKTQQDQVIHYTVTHAVEVNVNPIIRLHGEKEIVEIHSDHIELQNLDGVKIKDLPFQGGPHGLQAILPNTIDKIHGKNSITCSLEMARVHTSVIEHLHQQFEIKNFPAKWVKDIKVNDETQTIVEGLPEIMLEATEKCALFSELKLNWG